MWDTTEQSRRPFPAGQSLTTPHHGMWGVSTMARDSHGETRAHFARRPWAAKRSQNCGTRLGVLFRSPRRASRAMPSADDSTGGVPPLPRSLRSADVDLPLTPQSSKRRALCDSCNVPSASVRAGGEGGRRRQASTLSAMPAHKALHPMPPNHATKPEPGLGAKWRGGRRGREESKRSGRPARSRLIAEIRLLRLLRV